MEQDKKQCSLQIYEGKRGWRWRFYVGTDLRCICTNWHKTYDDALQDAKETVFQPWDIENAN